MEVIRKYYDQINSNNNSNNNSNCKTKLIVLGMVCVI